MGADAARVRMSASLLPLVPRPPEPKKTGPNKWVCLCPFHEDARPSMGVALFDRGWWFNCFACGERGDVIDYVQRTERLSFKAALSRLGGNEVTLLPPPLQKKKSHLLLCDRIGCANSLPVDIGDIPYLGTQLHNDWRFDRSKTEIIRSVCPVCALLIAKGVRQMKRRQ